MRRLVLPLALLCMPLAGCGGGGFQGVYLLHVPTPPEASTDSQVKDHNFSDGEEPDDGDTSTGDWTYDTSGTFSDTLLFVQIIDAPSGEVLLLLNGSVYPGSKIGGSYTFTWDRFSDGTQSEENSNDYEYVSEGSSHATTTFLILKKGKNLTGTASIDTTANQTYTETDEWDTYDVGRYSGVIPAGSYLVDNNGFSISNDPNTQDCDDDPCLLEIESTTHQDLTFIGEETSLSDDAFDHVETAGQPGGGSSTYNPY